MQAINKGRVAGLLQGLAQFGKTEHGITRLAYTAEDKAAQENGCSSRYRTYS